MTTTPNMNLILPDVNITPGPTWASLLNSAYSVIDSHDHSTGNGVKITPSGMNITGDLSFNQNNATNMRSSRLYNNTTFSTSVNDRTCLYAESGELHYIDGSGNDVKITDNGQIDVSFAINTLTLRDSTFTLQYFGDVTRQMQFDASAITPGNTRIYTMPDASSILINDTSSQTLSNKTVVGLKVSDFEEFTNTTAPATPAAGKTRLYLSSVDKVPHIVSDTGLDVPIGSGSGGAKNYLESYANFNIDPSIGMVTTLTTTGNRLTNQTVWGSNTTSLLSQDSTNKIRSVLSAKMVNASTIGNFIESPMFTLDPIDSRTNPLYISFELYEPDSYAVAGNWTLSVIRYDTSGNYIETISPSITQLPINYYSFKCAFAHSSTASDMYALRWTSTSSNLLTMYIDTLFVGPQFAVDTNVVGPWQLYTPTFSAGFGTVSSAKGYYRRTGDSIEIQFSAIAGTVAASVAYITLPTLLSVDTGKITAATIVTDPGITVGSYGDNLTAATGHMLVNAGTSTSNIYFGGLSTGATVMTPANGNVICSTGGFISGKVTVPIATFGTSTTLSTSPQLEYVYNTSSSDSDDTTSFGYGADGTTGVMGVTALTAPRAKRIRFQNPIQPTDRVQVEIKNNTGSWIPVNNTDATSGISSLQFQNAIQYGIGIKSAVVNSTDLDVQFGRYSYPSGATYGTAGNDWNTGLTGWRWRVAKYSAVGLAELAPASEISAGTISRESVWKELTFTTIGFTVTNTKVYYRVLGKSLFVRGSFTITSSSGSLTPGLVVPGFTRDTTKICDILPNYFESVGNFVVTNNTFPAGNNIEGNILCASNTGSLVYFGPSILTAYNLLYPVTADITLISGYTCSFKFEVPIV